MKLFTKDINAKLFKQFPMGSNLEKQFVVAKVFNPYGEGRWFLLNSDPEDPDYLWAIVQMHGEVEMGSVSRRELETLKVGRWKLPLERDLGFSPVNAAQLMSGLREGKFYKNGGWVEYANGGVVKWQDAQIGDNARVVAENKTGLIMQAYGRKFHLKFVDGTEKTYDAKELEFFTDEEFDSFSRGADGKMRVRFDAPARKGYAHGGQTDSMETVNEIGKLTGLRPVAVAEWGDKNNINLPTILKDLKSKKLSKLNLMTAVVGKKNNSFSKEILKKYSKN